jgi:hypothetical protein
VVVYCLGYLPAATLDQAQAPPAPSSATTDMFVRDFGPVKVLAKHLQIKHD